MAKQVLFASDTQLIVYESESPSFKQDHLWVIYSLVKETRDISLEIRGPVLRGYQDVLQ